MQHPRPRTAVGLLAWLILAALAIYYTVTLAGAVLGAVLAALLVVTVGYLLYVFGGRINDRLRHGKPIIRSGGEE